MKPIPVPPFLLRRLLGDSRAQAILEFGIAAPFILMMTLGTFVIGTMLDRHLIVTQVVRNAGNMYARGVDFSSTQNKNFIVSAAAGLDLQLTSGSTAVYLSTLTRIPADAQCDSGSGPRDCANNSLVVIRERYKIGDTSGSQMASRMGSPSQFVDASGAPALEGVHLNHFDLTEAQASGAPAALTGAGGLVENELVYVIEVIHRPVNLSFPGIFAPDLIYSSGYF